MKCKDLPSRKYKLSGGITTTKDFATKQTFLPLIKMPVSK